MITALVKTFLRDEYMKACVTSLEAKEVDVVIADDGYVTPEKQEFYKGRKVWYLPFDSGLPFGRNFLVDHTDSDYVLIGDDDFWYTEDSDIYGMIRLLEETGADICGGAIWEEGVVRHYEANLKYDGRSLFYEKIEPVYDVAAGMRYVPCDLTFNFVVISRRVFDKVRWDEEVKVAYEHTDFFLQCKLAGIRTIYTPDSMVVHKSSHVQQPDLNYMQYRRRRADLMHFYEKWGITNGRDINGQQIEYKDGLEIRK